MNDTERRKKRGNEGFSLVELLVAVIILGIIVGPLLHTFVTGAVTASKSRKIGDATLAAQNISETVEANTLAALLTNPAKEFDCSSGTVYVMPSGSTEEANAEPMSSVSYTESYYQFRLRGLKAGNCSFNAKVVLNAQPGNETAFSKINAAAVSDYSSMDAVYSQPYNVSDDPDQIAAKYLATEASEYTIQEGSAPATTRSITLTFSKKSGDNTRIMANLVYSYKYSFTAVDIDGNGNKVPSAKTLEYEESFNLLPQGFLTENGRIPNIYVMYNPWYGGTADSILIDDSVDAKVKVFLIKQKLSTSSETAETGYRANVLLQQSSSHVNDAKVFSNVRYNLYTDTRIPTVSYRIYYGAYGEAPNPLFSGASDKVYDGELVSKTARSRIFSVTVSIYPDTDSNMSGAALNTFSGSKLQ